MNLKNRVKIILMLVVMALPVAYTQACSLPAQNPVIPYLSLRSQGINAARDLIGVQQFVNLCSSDHHGFYGFAAATIEHDHSMSSHQIAQSLFGDDVICTPQGSMLTISGSTSPNRGSRDWLADYFGLPTDFKSTIFFKPKIQNLIADISFYWGLNQWADGLYVRFDIPLVHTKWSLNFCECVINQGVQQSFSGAFLASTCSSELSRSLLFANATDFFCGDSIDVIHPLQAAKWSCGCASPQNKTAASINAELGWNFVCCDDAHFGAKLRACAPTGDRPQGEFLFEPIVGNGHHWELGGGISAHSVLWRNSDDSTVSFYLEANITHFFKTCQTRFFDLCGKPNSRYMLAEQLGPNLEQLSGCTTPAVCANPTLSDNQMVVDLTLTGDFTPVANLTRTTVDVRVPVQGDIALKFAYTKGCGFEWDIGYNVWARSRERICRTKCLSKNPLEDGKTWALKGDAVTFGQDIESGNLTFHQLAATESCATIHSGTNGFIPGDETANFAAMTNPGIDKPEFSFVFTGPPIAVTNNSGDPIRTSIQPVYLTNDEVDLRGTNAISHKIFTHFNYTWVDEANWNPFVGIGASAEFGKNNIRTFALSQWGVWIKGGISFDKPNLCHNSVHKKDATYNERSYAYDLVSAPYKSREKQQQKPDTKTVHKSLTTTSIDTVTSEIQTIDKQNEPLALISDTPEQQALTSPIDTPTVMNEPLNISSEPVMPDNTSEQQVTSAPVTPDQDQVDTATPTVADEAGDIEPTTNKPVLVSNIPDTPISPVKKNRVKKFKDALSRIFLYGKHAQADDIS